MNDKNSIQKKLNKEQLAAVTTGPGPLLIIAGAGTGKTTVITRRIQHLIDTKAATPDQILAITFTEKAASEMESRLDEILPYGVTQSTVCTFHSLCDRILRDDAHQAGLPQNYTLTSQSEILSLVKKHLFDLSLDYFRPLGNPDKFLQGLLTHVDRLRDEDISPESYSSWVKKLPRDSAEEKLEYQKYQEIALFYTQYQALKLTENVMDFADLIYYTLHLFRTRPNVLKVYQSRWPWILVDEYQDTNFTQTEIVKLLSGVKPNVTVVADDDQAIYRWRGAAISNVLQFTHDYPTCQKIALTHNFRSTQTILNAAYTLITKNNPDRLEVQANIPKKLTSVRKATTNFPVTHFHYPNSEAEADGIISEIQTLLSAKNSTLQPKDVAILVRANSHVEPFVKSISRAGLPYQFLGPSRLFDRPEIKDLTAYLRLLVDTYDDTSLFRVLSSPWSGIGGSLVADLVSTSRRDRRPLIDVVRSNADESVTKLLSVFDSHRTHLTSLPAGEILYDLLHRLNWLSSLVHYETIHQEESAANIIRLFNKLKSHQASRADTSVPAVVDWLDFLSEIGESPQAAEIDTTSTDAINLLTVHSAKGLEFKIVFLVSLVSLRFPTVNRPEAIPVPDVLIKEILPQGDPHIQEERRLFYVGLTRARDRLYLTSADYYGDAKRAKKPSIFIFETLGDVTASNTQVSPQLIHHKQETPSPITYNHPPVTYLDYSRIQTFRDCPLHYKAKYILGLTAPPSAASTFGNVIYKTLKDYFEQLKRGVTPDISTLLDVNWDPRGFGDKKREDLYRLKGQRLLADYVSQLPKKKSLPVKLEEPFKFDLDGGSLTIGGKIDRLDLHQGGSLEIVDYKTASEKNQLDEKEASDNLQLSIYALAATRLKYPPFGLPAQNIILTLYYLDTGKVIHSTRTQAQLDTAVQEILEARDLIQASDFHCSGSFICREKKCDYRELCSSDP